MRDALGTLVALGGEVKGALEIAASTTIAQYILPRLLAAFGRRYPGIALQLESANTEHVVERVSAGRVALGLVEGPAHRPDLLVEPWISDELVLVVSGTHEWARSTITPEQLHTAPLLLREQGSGTRAVLEAALREAGLPMDRLRITMELGSTEALLACVEAGLGVGFASRFALRRQRKLHTLAIVPILGLRVDRTLSLIRQRGPNADLADKFTDFLEQFAHRRRAKTLAKLVMKPH